jgi:hypothetical protein
LATQTLLLLQIHRVILIVSPAMTWIAALVFVVSMYTGIVCFAISKLLTKRLSITLLQGPRVVLVLPVMETSLLPWTVTVQ